MVAIKSFTDLSQSKTLSTILPLESADMYWIKCHITFVESKYEVFVIDKSNKYIDFFKSHTISVENKDIIPCWSLAALFNVLPHIQEFYPIIAKINDKYVCRYTGSGIWTNGTNPVDACYEMILMLHELNLLGLWKIH